MVNIAVSVILILILFVTVFLTIVVLRMSQSDKKTSYVLHGMTVFLFVLGYLLEITSTNAGGAVVATKVMYLGAAFFTPVFLLFIMDFCEIKLNRAYFIVPMLIFSSLIVVMVWTLEYHNLLYTSYFYDMESPLHHLSVTQGKFYLTNHLYALVCMLAVEVILIHRLMRWDKRYRKQLVLLLVGANVPVLANVLFVLKLNVYGINYTPISLAILNAIFFIGMYRYNLLEILPRASAMALNSIDEAFVLLDHSMCLIDANPAAHSVFPGLSGLSKGSSISRLEDWPDALSEIKSETGEREAIQFSKCDHRDHYYNASVNSIKVKENKTAGWIILIQDVTNTVELLKQLEEAAFTDVLTGLYNRRYFNELATSECAKAKREEVKCYILMLDLDHFKQVNDKYGHPAGDAVLKLVASSIEKTIRPYDLLGRYGGEEFILFAKHVDDKKVLSFAERIRGNIENTTCLYDEQMISIETSIGIAEIRTTLEDAIKCADEALYKAKESGRNQCVLYKY